MSQENYNTIQDQLQSANQAEIEILPPPQVFLIAGLGNPGREYQQTRHNAGFMFANALAEKVGITFSRMEMKAIVAKTRIEGYQVVLAKPQTYMNRSGQAVSSLVRFYKIPLNGLLVVYDDVDLPFGAVRMRPGGGAGGHNGMRSIIQSLGSQDFPRLRIGVNRPPGQMDAADYVLQDFTMVEQKELGEIFSHAIDAAMLFITQGLDMAMNNANSPDK